jgi:hypothetical protein
MLSKSASVIRRAAVVAAVGLFTLQSARTSRAQDVLAGNDYWQTVTPTNVTFGGGGDFDAIPAGFFFPGSPPFSGTVDLEGMQVGPGTTDTIVQRMGDATLPTVVSSDTVPIEMTQLSLRSVAPITVGSSQWDVHVSIPPEVPQTLPPSTGMITITLSDPDGGTFSSTIGVTAQIRFVQVGGGGTAVLDPPPTLSLSSAPNCWSYTPWAGHLPLPGEGPNFFPSVCPGTGGTVIQPTTESHPMGAIHTASPAVTAGAGVPAVSTWGLAMVALLVICGGTLALRRRVPA